MKLQFVGVLAFPSVARLTTAAIGTRRGDRTRMRTIPRRRDDENQPLSEDLPYVAQSRGIRRRTAAYPRLCTIAAVVSRATEMLFSPKNCNFLIPTESPKPKKTTSRGLFHICRQVPAYSRIYTSSFSVPGFTRTAVKNSVL